MPALNTTTLPLICLQLINMFTKAKSALVEVDATGVKFTAFVLDDYRSDQQPTTHIMLRVQQGLMQTSRLSIPAHTDG